MADDPTTGVPVLRNFKRAARLTVYRMNSPASDTSFVVSPKTADAYGMVVTDLRMEFEIEKTLKHDPNTCSISITNLSESSRRAFSQKPLHVIMEAGYEGQLRVIFEGDITYGISTLEHPDWVTKLEMGDGSRASKGARINKSYAAGTTYRTMVKDLCKALGQPFPKNLEARANARVEGGLAAQESTILTLDDQVMHGHVLSGSARDRLTELLTDLDMSWSFQNNKLQILGLSEVALDEFEISERTGMIGSPDIGVPSKNGKPPNVKIKHVLYPELRPGARARVVSRELNGVFKILKVKHVGDTHGGSWETQLELQANAATTAKNVR